MAPGAATWGAAAAATGVGIFAPRWLYSQPGDADGTPRGSAAEELGGVGAAAGEFGTVGLVVACFVLLFVVANLLLWCWDNSEDFVTRWREREQLLCESQTHATIARSLQSQVSNTALPDLELRLRRAEHERDVIRAQTRVLRQCLDADEELAEKVKSVEAESKRLEAEVAERQAAGIRGKCQRQRAVAVSLRRQLDADGDRLPEVSRLVAEAESERETLRAIAAKLHREVDISGGRLPNLIHRLRSAEHDVSYWRELAQAQEEEEKQLAEQASQEPVQQQPQRPQPLEPSQPQSQQPSVAVPGGSLPGRPAVARAPPPEVAATTGAVDAEASAAAEPAAHAPSASPATAARLPPPATHEAPRDIGVA